ncbi:MAG: YihY/virulence factor BrkB family protein [Gemmatimonadaceae bacterium]
MVIGGYRVGALLKQVGKDIWADNVFTIAAAVAYNFFFSLFPLLLFAAPLVGLVGNKQRLMEWVLGRLAATVPPAAFELLQGVARDVVFAPNAPGLISLGAVLTLYSASNIFGSLMGALNTAYHVANDSRPWWKQKLIQLMMVVVVGALVTVAATVMIGGPEIVNSIATTVHMGGASRGAWLVLEYPIAFAFLVTAVWAIYYLLPDFRQSKRQILIGATAASMLWVAATILFRIYVIHFNQFNKAYGTVGAVLLLLTWMYYSMVVVLAGGELNADLAGRAGPAPLTPGAAVGTSPAPRPT